MKRRLFLSAIAATMPTAAWVRDEEPHRFKFTRNRIVLPGMRPKRILHIADIHMSDGMTADELEAGVVAGLVSRPGLICVTGDFVAHALDCRNPIGDEQH